MNEVSSHLIDNVFPQVEVRQWVISFPFSVRYLLAYNPKLITQCLAIFIRIVTNWYEKKARSLGFVGKTAAITFVQKFGDGIRSNTHLHSLFVDGVFDLQKDSPIFCPLPHPSDLEIEILVKRIRDRILKALRKKGYLEEGQENQEQPNLIEELNGNSVLQRISMGERKGQRVRSIGATKNMRKVFKIANRCAAIDGFSLHADTRIKADERSRLEKLLRYTARPAIALERLRETEDGKVVYQLKKKFTDGTSHLIFDPIEFIEKVVAIIPPPRANLLRYHGLFAPHSKYRSKIIPKPKKEEKSEALVPKYRKKTWADFLARSFAVDVMKCDECGGKMEIIATVVEPHTIRKILDHLGVPSVVPARAPPRAQPVPDEFSQCFGFEEAF